MLAWFPGSLFACGTGGQRAFVYDCGLLDLGSRVIYLGVPIVLSRLLFFLCPVLGTSLASFGFDSLSGGSMPELIMKAGFARPTLHFKHS